MEAGGQIIKFIVNGVGSILAIIITYGAIRWETYREVSPAILTMTLVTGYMSEAVALLMAILDVCENMVITILKIVFSLILLLTLIACACAGIAITKLQFEEHAREALAGYEINATEVRVWDHIQQDFGCCGIDNYTEWQGQGDLDNFSLPDSCCYLFTPGCGKGIVPRLNTLYDTDHTIYFQGCKDAGFFEFFYPWTYGILGVTLIMNTLSLIGMALSCEDGEAVDFSS